MKVQIKRAGPAISIRPRGVSSARLKFTPGVPGPAIDLRVNPATNRFEYRPQRSDGAWTEAPGSEFQGLIGSLTPEQLNFVQGGTGAVGRSVLNKMREWVSVKDFGARGDNTGDDATAISAADAAVAAAGGGILFFPPGLYPVGAALAPSANVIWMGAGNGASVIKIPDGDGTRNSIIRYVPSSDEGRQNITLIGLGFEGQWQAYQSQAADNGAVTLKYVKNVLIRDCAIRNSRAFGVNINTCDQVTVEGCTVDVCARDGIGVWGTPQVRILNNTVRHNDDDGISINYETADDRPVRSDVVVTGNFLEDAGPIRTQVPKNVLIANNISRRGRGAGVTVGVPNVAKIDVQAGSNIVVIGNVITDVIDRGYNVGAGTTTGTINARRYIVLESIKPQAGSSTVPPGDVDPATGTAPDPYGCYYDGANQNDGTGGIRVTQGVIISNNICRRTLPAAAAYSNWGFGPCYSMNGWVDREVTNQVMQALGVQIKLPVSDVLVESNLFETGYYGIWFLPADSVTLADRQARNIRIRNNSFRDFVHSGILWPGATTLTHQDILIEGNVFNGDPYFKNPVRGAAGTWASASQCVAINVPYLAGLVARGNTFLNVSAPFTQTGASDRQNYERNTIIADPAAVNFSTSNKGVGTIPPIGGGEQFWLISRNCDPTSPAYGQTYGAMDQNTSGLPTSGKWLAGTTVRTRGANEVSAGKILVEYRRITTGTGNVIDVDWRPVYSTTV